MDTQQQTFSLYILYLISSYAACAIAMLTLLKMTLKTMTHSINIYLTLFSMSAGCNQLFLKVSETVTTGANAL